MEEADADSQYADREDAKCVSDSKDANGRDAYADAGINDADGGGGANADADKQGMGCYC